MLTYIRWPFVNPTDNNEAGEDDLLWPRRPTATGLHGCLLDLLGGRRKYGGKENWGDVCVNALENRDFNEAVKCTVDSRECKVYSNMYCGQQIL